LAAAAILLPIALHLWNKRQGKTVKVGSLRWLQSSASRRWGSIRLSQVGLLLLRCLILLLLAVALAQPLWIGSPEKQPGRKAVLVSPDLFYSRQLPGLKPTIDSLLQRGYALHAYTRGFAPIRPEKWQQLNQQPTGSILTENENYWSLLPALAREYPNPQDSLWLFTSDLQRHFRGQRPRLAANIRWIPIALAQSTTWLQAAIQTAPDSLLLTVGHSTRAGTAFSTYASPLANPSIMLAGGQQFPVKRQGDSLAVFVGKVVSKVQLHTGPLQLVVLADKAQQDERHYLEAALRAISSYTGQPIRLHYKPAAKADWVFWLRAGEVPPAIQQQVARGLKLWLQPGAEGKPTQTQFYAGQQVIQVQRLDSAAEGEHRSLWETASGQPLLTAQRLGQGTIYRFHSGFGPAWSTLGQSPLLPELLLPLLCPQPAAFALDARALDEKQLRPQTTAVARGKTTQQPHYSLFPWAVLLAFVLFLIERLWANRRADQ